MHRKQLGPVMTGHRYACTGPLVLQALDLGRTFLHTLFSCGILKRKTRIKAEHVWLDRVENHKWTNGGCIYWAPSHLLMNPYTLYTDIKTAITVAVDKGAGSNKQSAVTTRTSYHCHDPKSTQEAQSSRGFPPPCVYLSSKELKKKKFCLVCMNTNT